MSKLKYLTVLTVIQVLNPGQLDLEMNVLPDASPALLIISQLRIHTSSITLRFTQLEIYFMTLVDRIIFNIPYLAFVWRNVKNIFTFQVLKLSLGVGFVTLKVEEHTPNFKT